MKNPDAEKVIRFYYEKMELTNNDIKELFDVSDAYLQRIKKPVKKAMAERNIKSWLPYSINTKVAYDVWGIDIKEYEARIKKINDLKTSGIIN